VEKEKQKKNEIVERTVPAWGGTAQKTVSLDCALADSRGGYRSIPEKKKESSPMSRR